MARRNRDQLGHEGRRLSGLFALFGGGLWMVSAMFILWGFGDRPGPQDWVTMHQAKLEVAVGVGLAGIGSLFICFAALIMVTNARNG